MTNPFANAPGTATATAPAQAPAQAPQQFAPQPSNGFGAAPVQQFADAPSTQPAPAPKPAATGDPFSDPSGQSGEKIADMLGRLIIAKPLEIIPSMITTTGKEPAENVVRCNIVILDDPAQPGKFCENVLVFQTALKRDLADIFRDPAKALLLGRIVRGQASGNKSAPYLFQKATEEDRALAVQFRETRPGVI